MTNILWLCNVPLSIIANKIGLNSHVGGGWMDGLYEILKSNNSLNITVCFFTSVLKEQEKGEVDKSLNYIALPADNQFDTKVSNLREVIKSLNPQIVHVFGSEKDTAYAMCLASKKEGYLNKTVLHIQGLVSVYVKHYTNNIPLLVKYFTLPRDFFKNATIWGGIRSFQNAGKIEEEIISLIPNLSGRTTWDKACAKQINPFAKYYKCNEALRPSFYKAHWSIDRCNRHSIFVSQGNYPIKGLHYMIDAMRIIHRNYPDVTLFVAGRAPFEPEGDCASIFKRTTYGWYVRHLIRKYKLSDNIVFTGPLNEEEMCGRYLKSHVFVSPSTIENSPNSLGEAMLLGMPCVSSFVGGVPDMLKDREEGFLYQADAPYMLAHYVMELFEDDLLASQMGERARKKAMKTHNVDQIYMDLLKMYQDVGNMEE